MSEWSIARGAALLVLLVLLGLVTRRDRVFLPLLAYFGWMAAVDVARKPLEELRYDHRVLLHVDQALYLSVILAFLWACSELFESALARWGAIGSWALATLVLAVGHPLLPDGFSAYVYTTASLIALGGCWIVILRAVLARTSIQPTLAHLAAMVLVAGDTVVTLYGFVDLAPGGTEALAASWDAIRAVNVLSLLLSGIVCAIALARLRVTTRTPRDGPP